VLHCRLDCVLQRKLLLWGNRNVTNSQGSQLWFPMPLRCFYHTTFSIVLRTFNRINRGQSLLTQSTTLAITGDGGLSSVRGISHFERMSAQLFSIIKLIGIQSLLESSNLVITVIPRGLSVSIAMRAFAPSARLTSFSMSFFTSSFPILTR